MKIFALPSSFGLHMLSLIPVPHPERILKTIRTGVGFGSGTETSSCSMPSRMRGHFGVFWNLSHRLQTSGYMMRFTTHCPTFSPTVSTAGVWHRCDGLYPTLS